MEEPRLEMLARQHGIRQKRNDSAIGKTLINYVRRADEGNSVREATYGGLAHSWLDREASVLHRLHSLPTSFQ
jgi:hypothetical protein